MNSDTKNNSLSQYLVCILPIAILIYISLDSYGVDFRVFYLAGKAVTKSLDPYINWVHRFPEFYSPVNANLNVFSGWRYPAFSSLLFVPFSFFSYVTAKLLFVILSITSAFIAIFFYVRSDSKVPPISIIIATISFPALSVVIKGQIEFLMVSFFILGFYLFNRNRFILSGIIFGLCGLLHLFPMLISFFLFYNKKIKCLLTTFFTFMLGFLVMPLSWNMNFIRRSLPTYFHSPVLPHMLHHLPNGQGFFLNMYIKTMDAPLFSYGVQRFTYGYLNPLLIHHSLVAIVVGLFCAFLMCHLLKNESMVYRFLSFINCFNIINPVTWIMGVVWFIPYFLYNYRRVNNLGKFILTLPLLLPPMLNVSAYLAFVIPIFFSYSKKFKLTDDPDNALDVAQVV